MAEITLISTAQAKPGFRFVFQGGAPVCRSCPYRHACLTLAPGHRYEVAQVRPVEHPCALQECPANVVEVRPVPRAFVVEPAAAIPGGSVEVARYPCRRLDCPNYDLCASAAVPARERFRIESVEPRAADCRIGRTLKRVEAV